MAARSACSVPHLTVGLCISSEGETRLASVMVCFKVVVLMCPLSYMTHVVTVKLLTRKASILAL